MMSSVAHLIFFASMLTLLDCVLCYNYGRDEDPSVDQRLDRLESKVEILTNEVDKLLSENSDENQGESIQQPGVTVLEVRRVEEGEMIRFTVKYDSGEETVETRWLNFIDEAYSEITTAVGDGVYETTALFPRPPHNNNNGSSIFEIGSRVWLLLELPDYKEQLSLYLYLSDHDAVQRDILTTRLEIEPAGDFVYQEGEEFSFKLRFTRTDQDGPSSGVGDIHFFTVLLDPTTGKVSRNYDNDDVFQIGEEKKFQNYVEMTVRVNGTETGISGFVNFNYGIDTNGDVVKAVQRDKQVILRPSSQEGPFPDGYLGFVKEPNDMRSGLTTNYGGDQFMCTLGEDCYYECMVAGNDISDVTVRRLKADGTSQTLNDTERLYRTTLYLRHEDAIFQVDSIPEEPDRILCVANNTEGRSISKEVSILVTTPVSIVVEDSHIVMVSHDENEAVFEISCTVKGHPQPNVTFNIYGPKTQFGEKPDVTLDRGDHVYTMIKTVRYDAEVVNRSWFYLNVECTAERNSPYWGYDYHSMTYHHNDST